MNKSPTTTVKTPPHRKRAGVSILETLGALAMLSITLAGICKMVVAVDRQQQSRDHRAAASLALENQLEQVLTRPWDQITGEEEMKLHESITNRLPDAKGAFRVATEEGPLGGKRVTATLSWRPTRGSERAKLTLTTTVYPVQEDAP